MQYQTNRVSQPISHFGSDVGPNGPYLDPKNISQVQDQHFRLDIIISYQNMQNQQKLRIKTGFMSLKNGPTFDQIWPHFLVKNLA